MINTLLAKVDHSQSMFNRMGKAQERLILGSGGSIPLLYFVPY